MEHLISVIVPIYCVEKYLNKCVESIVNQTYSNLEIILVDDGSPDRCPKICDEWAKKDSRIKVIHKENGGMSDARNAGLEIASGDYIAFIDSDDWIEQDMFAILINTLNKNNCDIAICNMRKVYKNKNISVFQNTFEEHLYNTTEALALLIDDRIRQVVWDKMYRRNAIKDIRFPVGKYHEDIFWIYQAIGNAKSVAIIDYMGYNYFQHPESVMGVGYSLKRLDAVEAKYERLEYVRHNFTDLQDRAVADFLLTCIYHGQMSLLNLSSDDQKAVFRFLESKIKTCKLQKNIIRTTSIKNLIWFILSKLSLPFVCKIKNLLKIGL